MSDRSMRALHINPLLVNMQAFPYSNPYTQNKKSLTQKETDLEHILEQLQANTNEPLLERLSSCLDASWTLASVNQFIDWVSQVLEDSSSPYKAHVLSIFSQVIQRCWSDEQIYAAAILKDNTSILELLEGQVFEKNSLHAFVALMMLWRGLDRVHQLTSSAGTRDQVWWMESRDWQETVPLALKFISTEHSDKYIRSEEIQIAATSFLVQLLQHEHGEWLLALDPETLSQLSAHLQTQVDRLNDPNMPISSFTKLSLVSLQLLLLVKALTFSETGGLLLQNRWTETLKHVVRATLCENPAGPRWTHSLPTHDERLKLQWTLPVLLTWCQVETIEANKTIVSVAGASDLQRAWNKVLDSSHDRQHPSGKFQVLCFLLSHCRFAAREALDTILATMETNSGLKELVVSMVDYIRQGKSLTAAVCLRTLLEDARSSALHDKLSRDLWDQALDGDLAQQFLELILSTSIQTSHPIMLCLLDITHLMLSLKPKVALTTLSRMPSQTIDSLVRLMTPKSPIVVQSLGESESSTPCTNNLSRLDEPSLILLDDDEEDKAPRGLESGIRLAVATILAILSQVQLEDDECDGRTACIQTRMSDSVSNFMEDKKSPFSTADGNFCSLDLTRRRVRLMSALSSPANEGLLASLLYSNDRLQSQKIRSLEQTKTKNLQKLEQMHARETKLLAEKESLSTLLSKQAANFQRQMIRAQREATQNSRELTSVHQLERSKAERRAEELARNEQDREHQLMESKRAVEACQKAEAEAKARLEVAETKMYALAEKEKRYSDRAAECARKADRYKEELATTKNQIRSLVEDNTEMKAHIEKQQESLEAFEESDCALRESLESLFADFVSLAQLYQLKEKDDSSTRANGAAVVEKLERRLKEERLRFDELAEKFRQTECDNEMLSRKYEKIREKLEQEREERQRQITAERRKRTGPVSYMNQLQTSGFSSSRDRSALSEKSSREKSYSSRSEEGKENSTLESSSHRSQRSNTSSHSRSRKYR